MSVTYLRAQRASLQNQLQEKQHGDDRLIIDYDPNRSAREQTTEFITKYFDEKFPVYRQECEDSIAKLEQKITKITEDVGELKERENSGSHLERAKKVARFFRCVGVILISAIAVLSIIGIAPLMVVAIETDFYKKNMSLKSHRQFELENQWKKLEKEKVKNPLLAKVVIATENEVDFKNEFQVLPYFKDENPSEKNNIQQKVDDYTSRIEEIKSKLNQPLFSLA